jgi:hypothetical protein
VASDPRRLRPSELCRLLNSTSLGEVINDRQLHRHRTRAGNRVGDGKHVDLLRYIGWLVQTRHAPRHESDEDSYERMKDRARARNAALALAGRDIGELPPVVNPERKARCALDFQFFCESYFPRTFHLAWSADHIKVMQRIEQAVLRGGLFSMAMPRGSGKTTICECACIWAVLNGHREFVCLIGSDEGHAMDMLESIKMELDGNELLLADYPEVVFPIQALDGIANRCNGQLYQGNRTHIGWTAKEVVLPTMPGSIASGAIIKVAGITGRIRGMKYKRSDGKTVRPSLVVLDDPQTDESARSLSQCATRESILAGAILGLSGPGKKISGIMPCTVIRPGDMADNILSRDKHPEWNGERTRMVYEFPSDEKLWTKYAELRAESLRSRGDISLATQFYGSNRLAMDLGSRIAWPERYNHDELSAIQHAMNLKLQDQAAFFAEYQNEPLPEQEASDNELTPDQIAAKFNRIDIVALGAAATGLGTVFSAAAAVIVGIGQGIAILGTAIAALVSPIGLTIAGLTALVAYLLYTSGAGTQAMKWLGDRFNELKDTALAAWKGIGDALAAGDIALAGKILWLTLKMEWQRGVAFLQSKWLDFKGFFIGIFQSAVYSVAGLMTDAWAGLQTGWLETTHFIADIGPITSTTRSSE